MTTSAREPVGTKLALGNYLASIRADRGMTLREVEQATEKQVSNAYLSQIEKGKIGKPSPNILNALADLYKIDFERLMEMSGYVVARKKKTKEQRHGILATFAEHDLSAEEEEELIGYLQFMRSRKKG